MITKKIIKALQLKEIDSPDGNKIYRFLTEGAITINAIADKKKTIRFEAVDKERNLWVSVRVSNEMALDVEFCRVYVVNRINKQLDKLK